MSLRFLSTSFYQIWIVISEWKFVLGVLIKIFTEFQNLDDKGYNDENGTKKIKTTVLLLQLENEIELRKTTSLNEMYQPLG